jgi:DNA-binding MarR family transcriptional regulator
MTTRPDLEQSLGFLVADIARLLRERFNATAEKMGLTLAQTRVLARLSANEGLNQSELAALLEVQPITLLRQIDRLEAMELVERRAHPTDRRVQRLFLTRKAQPLLNRLVRLGESMQEDWLGDLRESERDQLYALLDRVRANLRRITSKSPQETPSAPDPGSRVRRRRAPQ